MAVPTRNFVRAKGSSSGFLWHCACIVAWAILLSSCWQSSANAGDTCQLCPQDQIWLVSTRSLDCCAQSAVEPTVKQYAACSGWQPSSVEALAASDGRPTVFYVHGNRFTYQESISRGWQVYHRLRQRTSPSEAIRLVIWSWPSAQIKGQLKDVRAKYARTTVEGYYLANVLRQFPANDSSAGQISLMGHSYGCRVISGGLHLLGGGQLAGRALATSAAPRVAPARVVFFAAAQNQCSLSPSHRFGLAAQSVDKLLSLYNSCDYALKRFRFVDCNKGQALGHRGMTGVAAYRDRLVQRDVSSMIGKKHEDDAYIFNGKLMSLAADYVLWRDVDSL